MKHSINSCTNLKQLKGVANILPNVLNHDEFLVLIQYYEAKEMELELNDLNLYA